MIPSGLLFIGGPLHGARFEVPENDQYFEVVVPGPRAGAMEMLNYTHTYQRQRLKDLDGEVIEFMVSADPSSDKPTFRSLLPQGR